MWLKTAARNVSYPYLSSDSWPLLLIVVCNDIVQVLKEIRRTGSGRRVLRKIFRQEGVREWRRLDDDRVLLRII
jgi:hypothetical protein